MNNKNKCDVVLKQKIIKILNILKAPKRNKGFRYLVQAVEVQADNIGLKTMDIYARIAKDNNDTISRVERSIRHEIECIMSNKENDEQKLEILNNDLRITNSEFIYCIVYYLDMI